ncbi:MAG: VanW family protein, partial [candidate division Zixibacteria bacterium]|nr:VanW family protein [candidate division Zixibacteria bacterium]
SVESDFAYQLINFDAEKILEQIFAFGRNKNFLYNLNDKINALLFKKNYSAIFTLNDKEIVEILENNFSDYYISPRDAKLVYTTSYSPPYIIFSVENEITGQIIEYDKALRILKEKLSRLDATPINLSSKIVYPKIYKKDCLNIQAKANRILKQAPLTLYCQNSKWYIKRDGLAAWLTLQFNKSNNENGKIIIGLDRDAVKNYLQENISSDINQEAKDAKFEIKDGRVVEFQASQDGLELNLTASLQKIAYELLANNNNEIKLSVSALKSNLTTENINNLGIKEIIGTGESNFSGSPQNRRYNIAIGASTLNGIIIKPDEEFSLMTALGDIDKEAGYLPELVIKDNKTVPEYGGGLCQIGTTMFRAALGTGLPITMRRNHSYRVFYYEPAGTDATIYDPWPDLKFINDTGNSVLIQSRIEGNNLFFDFWGTLDGRTATRTYPIITNIVRPGPTKIIETLDLGPGEKKCTEHAHNGADAYFDYIVIYSPANPPAELKDEEKIAEEDLIIEKRFRSHYVPWREVCLLGVEELSENKTATSTEEKVEEKN